MQKMLLTLLGLFCAFQLFAQNSIKIKGQVSDSLSKSGIPYATVSLAKPDDLTFSKKLASGGDGKFEILVNSEGEYVLTIQSIGYAVVTNKITVEKNQKLVDLGIIQVKESNTQLNTVQVVAEKPLVKVEADKITYNTESDPETKTLNALDMLRKVPLVTVDGDDNVQIKGSGNFKIHINGKPSTMANSNPKEFLRNMPATNIKNIEVITSPGAKYDAEGIGGILNIITQNKTVNGYNCTISTGGNNIGNKRGSIYFSTALGKFAFSTNLSVGSNNSPKLRTEFYRENYTNDAQKYTIQNGNRDWNGYYPYGNGELSYEIDTLNLISGSFDFWGGGNKSESETNTQILNSDKQLVAESVRRNTSNSSWGGPSGNINYQHISKKDKERILTFSYQYNGNPDYNKNVTENTGSITTKQKSENEALSSEHTFQTDYVFPLKNQSKLESGLKYIYRLNRSETDYYNFDYDINDYVVNHLLDNDFNHSQNIQAFYLTYNKQFKKVGFKIGSRIENSVLSGKFESQENSNFTNQNLEIVPSANISYNLSPMQTLSLAYNMRIQRPGIWYLNPYIDNTDPLNIRFGNPNLDPERYHNVDLSYNLFTQKINLNTSLSGSYSNNGINEFSIIDDNNVKRTTFYNITDIKSVNLSVYINWRITKKISLNLNASSDYSDIKTTSKADLTANGFGMHGWAGLQYNIGKGFKAGMNGFYFKSGASLQEKQEPFYSAGISVSKDFFEKKLSLSLNFRDIFWKERYWGSEINDPGFYEKGRFYRPARSVGFNISYRFGEMDQGVKKTQRSINNDDTKGGGSKGGE